MPKSPKLEYTGTWVPAHIMEDKQLSAATKLTYAIIASFREACYASNKWLAGMVGVTTRTITASIATLEERGLVARAGDNESDRVLIAIRHDPRKNFQGGTKKFLAPLEKISTNNKEDNKREKPTVVAQSATPPAQTPSESFDGQPADAGQHELPPTPPAPPSTNALHYRVIKKYALPVSNHLHVAAKSKRFDEEIGPEAAQEYLQRLLDVDYQSLQGDFKPELNHSRDVYDKRIQVTKFLDEHAPKPAPVRQTKTPVELAKEREQQRTENGGWGF